jgi:hypothetical protein
VGTILNIAYKSPPTSVLWVRYFTFQREKINNMLNVDKQSWIKAGSDTLLPAGLGVAALLFEKIEDDVIAGRFKNFTIKEKYGTCNRGSKTPETRDHV